MRITNITIENFKGIREPVNVQLKPITLLFGPNSAGKSSIFQSLHYLRELLERNNADADRSIAADESFDLGGFRNLVHNHDLNRRIRLKVAADLAGEELPSYQQRSAVRVDDDLPGRNDSDLTEWDINQHIDIKNIWVELEVGWSSQLEKPFIASYATGFNGEHFATITSSEDGKRVRIASLNLAHKTIDASEYGRLDDESWNFLQSSYHNVINDVIVGSGNDLNLYIESNTALPVWNTALRLAPLCLAPPPEDGPYTSLAGELEGYLSQLIVGPGELLLKLLKGSRYIGPIRKTPPRNYTSLRSVDETRWSSGLAAWDLLYRSPKPFVEQVSSWLSREDRLNSGYSLRMYRYKKLDMDGPLYRALVSSNLLEEDFARDISQLPDEQQLVLFDEKRLLEVFPQDIGVGISQMLPVAVGALDKGTSVLLVEQPELHVHPGLQVNIGDLFIHQIQDEAKLFMVETHSEHLLLRLLRRIRETSDDGLPPEVAPLQPEQLSVNYIEPSEEGLRIRQLLVSPDGDSLGAWPKGFFEERAGELF